MNCDQTRDLLPEYALGSLDDIQQTQVDRHLRGCGPCRSELTSLTDGISTLALATHDEPPPEGLRDRVLGVLDQEWAADSAAQAASAPVREAAGRRNTSTARWAWLVAAAAALVAVASLGWGATAQHQTTRARAEAAAYDRFLGALGGEGVRVGTLHSPTHPSLEGSLVVYDSKVGQSWVMILLRAPGVEGPLRASISTPSGSPIALRPVTIGPDGDGSTWLVTGKDLHAYDRVTVTDPSGQAVASGTVSAT